MDPVIIVVKQVEKFLMNSQKNTQKETETRFFRTNRLAQEGKRFFFR